MVRITPDDDFGPRRASARASPSARHPSPRPRRCLTPQPAPAPAGENRRVGLRTPRRQEGTPAGPPPNGRVRRLGLRLQSAPRPRIPPRRWRGFRDGQNLPRWLSEPIPEEGTRFRLPSLKPFLAEGLDLAAVPRRGHGVREPAPAEGLGFGLGPCRRLRRRLRLPAERTASKRTRPGTSARTPRPNWRRPPAAALSPEADGNLI